MSTLLLNTHVWCVSVDWGSGYGALKLHCRCLGSRWLDIWLVSRNDLVVYVHVMCQHPYRPLIPCATFNPCQAYRTAIQSAKVPMLPGLTSLLCSSFANQFDFNTVKPIVSQDPLPFHLQGRCRLRGTSLT